MVEACSASLSDLMHAELGGVKLVEAQGGGDISNSWGSGEFAGETTQDLNFFTPSPFATATGFVAQDDR